MAFITLRFTAESDLVSASIRFKTWCGFSHCEFVLDDGTTLAARSSGGVAIRPLNYAKFSQVAYYTVEVTDAEKKAILDFARAQLGKGYDFEAIAGVVVHRDWRSKDRWFCSELVAAAFEVAKPLVNVSPNVDRIVPRDILLSTLLKPAQPRK